jgi:hypothetical protein
MRDSSSIPIFPSFIFFRLPSFFRGAVSFVGAKLGSLRRVTPFGDVFPFAIVDCGSLAQLFFLILTTFPFIFYMFDLMNILTFLSLFEPRFLNSFLAPRMEGVFKDGCECRSGSPFLSFFQFADPLAMVKFEKKGS